VRGGPKVPIIRHPDVRRMLLSMKAHTEAMRALVYQTAAALDEAHHAADEGARAEARAFAELMIPVVKGWCTESAIRIASTGVQVHGGMGFVEETGAAQHYRDARILTIYEGTTGIQANDLVGRKLARDGGAAARAAIVRMRETAAELADVDLGAIGSALERGITALEEAMDFVLAAHPREPRLAAAGAVPLLELFGIVAGGWQMARAALIAQRRLAWETDGDAGFYRAKLDTAAFYATHFLPQAMALREAVVHGSASVLALDEAAF
jgi:acyl-CoA dehydrogenase